MNDALESVMVMTQHVQHKHPTCKFLIEMNQETWNKLKREAEMSNKFLLDMSILLRRQFRK